MNVPRKVILHCSATKDSGDAIGAEIIDDWHKERGWKGIGYHWVIRRSGVLEPGRDENAIGAHTRGMNKNSLGICLVGTDDFEAKQIDTLIKLNKQIKERWNIPVDEWYCHYEFANKACPNIPVEVLRKLLKLSF